MKKHLNKIKFNSIIFIIAALIWGCDNEKSRTDYVAKVNDSYLTGKELAELADTSTGKKYYKNEVINNWIERELLYQEAVKEGITNEESYKQLIENSKKELAVSMYLNKYLEEETIRYTRKDVESYFEENKNDFKLIADTYIINRVDFINEDKAILFRNTVIESNWNKALNSFNSDSAFIKSYAAQRLYDYEIHPAELYKVVTSLDPAEVSILLPIYAGMYTIVQVESKYNKDEIPAFDLVKDEVESRYVQIRKNKLFKELMENLYSNNDVEIKTR
ncbi:MAG: hypothetical protein IPM56_02200 [Ignavibacteriales bacterium]|nr:MAG: hypothetical protein IPM56_02200 [Ignavibacteriales bacterium]